MSGDEVEILILIIMFLELLPSSIFKQTACYILCYRIIYVCMLKVKSENIGLKNKLLPKIIKFYEILSSKKNNNEALQLFFFVNTKQ